MMTRLLHAQSNPVIRTGRPGQAIGPYVVGTGYFQVQSGINHQWKNGDEKSFSRQQNNVIRFGLTEKFEISSAVNFRNDRLTRPDDKHLQGLSDFQPGFRYNINDKSDDLIPGLGIQTRFKLTNVDSDYKARHMANSILIVTSNRLSSATALSTNTGVSYDGTTSIPTYIYIVNYSFSLDEKWGGVAELFGTSTSGTATLLADTGLSYLVNNDFQLDAFTGGGNNHGVSDLFVSFGFSWRTNTLGKNHSNSTILKKGPEGP